MSKFMIHGVSCEVLPEDRVNEVLNSAQNAPQDFHIIGNCLLHGHRYVVVCQLNREVDSDSKNSLPAELLTRRELQVAMMVCQGRGNKQIAHLLHLSEWTVSSYLRRVFSKLGVRTRTAMVAKIMTCAQEERTASECHLT